MALAVLVPQPLRTAGRALTTRRATDHITTAVLAAGTALVGMAAWAEPDDRITLGLGLFVLALTFTPTVVDRYADGARSRRATLDHWDANVRRARIGQTWAVMTEHRGVTYRTVGKVMDGVRHVDSAGRPHGDVLLLGQHEIDPHGPLARLAALWPSTYRLHLDPAPGWDDPFQHQALLDRAGNSEATAALHALRDGDETTVLIAEDDCLTEITGAVEVDALQQLCFWAGWRDRHPDRWIGSTPIDPAQLIRVGREPDPF